MVLQKDCAAGTLSLWWHAMTSLEQMTSLPCSSKWSQSFWAICVLKENWAANQSTPCLIMEQYGDSKSCLFLPWGDWGPSFTLYFLLLRSSWSLLFCYLLGPSSNPEPSFILLRCFCIPLSLKSILSKPESNYVYFRFLHTTTGSTECKPQTALCQAIYLWLATGYCWFLS